MDIELMTAPTINTNYNFPHIDIWNITNDNNELLYYEAKTQTGYVMYDPNRHDIEIDPDTDEEIPVTYYYTSKALPLTFNFNNFPWVAVLRSTVDENYIFGGGDNNDHEIM